ncbi:hypothetical protein BGX38DRAFT_1153117, partial [Terfezia claveryi]
YGTTRSIRFLGLYGKRGLHSSPSTNTDSDADPEESCEEVPVSTHIHNRLGKLEKAYAALGSKVDAGFNQVNDRFDKFDQRLDKVDGWVKWGVRVSLGLIVVGFGAMFESRDHVDKKIDKNQQEMRNFITKSIKESEARLQSNLTLAFVREVHHEVRCEVQHAMGLVNARKNVEA